MGRRCTHPAARDAVSFLANAGPSPNRAKFPIHEQGTWFENPAPLPSPRPRKSPTQSTLKVVPKTKAQTQTETVTATSEFEFPPLKSLSPYLLSLMFPPPSLLSPKTLHTNLSATSFIGQKIPSKMLSTTLLSHFNALRSSIFTGKPTLPTQNVMLTGPSGSGKTHIIETYLRQVSSMKDTFTPPIASSFTHHRSHHRIHPNTLLRSRFPHTCPSTQPTSPGTPEPATSEET